MAGQWDTWLATMKAAGKGGERFPQLTIDRGLAYEKVLGFGVDVSGDTFRASLRASPDAADPTLADFTVAVGAYADGLTLVTLTLSAVATAALPSDGDLDGVEELVFDLLRNNSRFMAGTIPLAGKVTNAL